MLGKCSYVSPGRMSLNTPLFVWCVALRNGGITEPKDFSVLVLTVESFVLMAGDWSMIGRQEPRPETFRQQFFHYFFPVNDEQSRNRLEVPRASWTVVLLEGLQVKSSRKQLSKCLALFATWFDFETIRHIK